MTSESELVLFEAGDQIRFKSGSWNPAYRLSASGTFFVDCIVRLPRPNSFCVPRKYWDKIGYEWARGLTRIKFARGHPQVLFLKDDPAFVTGVPMDPMDPMNRGRLGHSGSMFDLVRKAKKRPKKMAA